MYWLRGRDLPGRVERMTAMRRYTIALLLGMLALSAAACGSDDGDGGVASVDGTASESASDDGGGGGGPEDFEEEALAYSECMRDNGIEEFPDPELSEGRMGLALPKGIDPESEEFKAAEEACEDMRPGPDENATIDPELYDQLLAYSECMRENGIEEFPDPNPNGGIVMNGELGFDPESEEFQAADEACADLRPERGGSANDSEDE
jgi:hypothetical protein